MEDDKKVKNAQNVYNTLCEMLDEKEVHYEKHVEDLVVVFAMKGDDFPIQFIVNIDAKRQLVRVLSPLPVTFEDDKRVEGAIATSQINYRLADGSFDYDYAKGKVYFRMTSSFADSLLSKDLFEYMIAVSSYTVDDYNDKLYMLAKGKLSVEDFFEKE